MKRDLKLPRPVTDLVANLRERRLLPVAIALVVAIVAAPILLAGGGSGEQPAADAENTAAATGADVAPEAQLAVIGKSEGLRDYRKRLGGEGSKDPFKQQYGAPPAGNGATTGALESTVAPTGNAAASTGAGSTASTGSSTASTGSASARDKTVTVEVKQTVYTLDVWVGEVGDLRLRKGVRSYEPLPSRQVAAAAWVGLTRNEKRAVFALSDTAQSLGGGNCLLDTATCELLTLKEGGTAQITYGDKTYAVKLAKITKLTSKNPE